MKTCHKKLRLLVLCSIIILGTMGSAHTMEAPTPVNIVDDARHDDPLDRYMEQLSMQTKNYEIITKYYFSDQHQDFVKSIEGQNGSDITNLSFEIEPLKAIAEILLQTCKRYEPENRDEIIQIADFLSNIHNNTRRDLMREYSLGAFRAYKQCLLQNAKMDDLHIHYKDTKATKIKDRKFLGIPFGSTEEKFDFTQKSKEENSFTLQNDLKELLALIPKLENEQLIIAIKDIRKLTNKLNNK